MEREQVRITGRRARIQMQGVDTVLRVSSTRVWGVVGAVPGRMKSEWVLISHLRQMEYREKKDEADVYGGVLWYAVCVCVCGGSLLP